MRAAYAALAVLACVAHRPGAVAQLVIPSVTDTGVCDWASLADKITALNSVCCFSWFPSVFPLADWLRAMLGGALPQEWRLLDDLAGSAGNASALPVDEDEWGEEAQRMLCAARFIATVGEAWKGNLTDSNAHLYVRQFHSACPGFPEH